MHAVKVVGSEQTFIAAVKVPFTGQSRAYQWVDSSM
jgi:hypothetical protein